MADVEESRDMTQQELPLLDVLTAYPTLLDALKADVYGCGRQFKYVAADLGLDPRKLERMLLAQDAEGRLNLPLELIEQIIETTGGSITRRWWRDRFEKPANERAYAAAEELLSAEKLYQQAKERFARADAEAKESGGVRMGRKR